MFAYESLAVPQPIRKDDGFPIFSECVGIRTVGWMDRLDEESEFHGL